MDCVQIVWRENENSRTHNWVYKLPILFVARELKNRSEHTITDAREVCIDIIKADDYQGGV